MASEGKHVSEEDLPRLQSGLVAANIEGFGF